MEIELLMTSRLSRFTSREFGSPAASTTIMVVKNSNLVFSEHFFYEAVSMMPETELPLKRGETKEDLLDELVPVIFDEEILPKRVNQTDGVDPVATSACNFYEDVTRMRWKDFMPNWKDGEDLTPPSYGLNSKLMKRNGEIVEMTWKEEAYVWYCH